MASKPVIFTLDDDPEVLQAIQRDLRGEFGKDYRIMRAEAGAAALEALQQMKLRNDEVALFLVDQRMPEMSGVEFLGQARDYFPNAKRALLTAYADTNAAIQAINEINLDYYLMKPWDPPEEHLFPVIHDLLDQWQSSYRPAFEGLRVIGHQWSPDAHRVKDFLARNRVPYRWMDMESDPNASPLIALIENAAPPVVLFPDGSSLVNPSNVQIAERVGLKTQAAQPFYDLAIVGGGPAGLAAAVYGASEGLRTILIEREAPGGQAGTSSRIENYLGFPSGLSGNDLARRAVAQASRFGVEILTPAEVIGIRVEGQYRILVLSDGKEVSCHALMIATGVSYRRIEVMGCDALTGLGVYYGAAMTEAPSMQGKDLFIVGAGNSAGQAAMYFSKYAATVYMVVRGDSLGKSMSQYLVDQIEATPNIKVLLFTEVMAVHGTEHLEAVTLINKQTRETEKYPAAGLFVFIGALPHTDWLEGVVERDEYGFILTGSDLVHDGKPPKGWKLERMPFLLEASVPGIFVAGDVRHRSVKRVASAVGEGSIAVQFIHQYLGEL
ncbi:MAG TPA: FAD-dependent oxidoreductase [Phototrophicaceae bacterium]|nr:FAD-dependent oxidoreductase [Phototrophicaceae bacterium]